MKTTLLTIVAALAPLAAAASGVEGVWKTEANDEGGYLEVTLGPCQQDASLTCGLITGAVQVDTPNPDYEHLGKLMIEDMERDGEGTFSGGTVWDPEADKVYKSKIRLEGEALEVDGCIAFICVGQTWTRVP